MSVVIEPSTQLTFSRPLTRSSDEILVVKNPHPEPRTFKVKTTAPKQYCVRPNAGRIEPNSQVEVHVILQPLPNEPPADFKCKDKFLVQTAIIKPEYQSMSISDMWSHVESEDRDSIRQQKIKCVYLPPDEPVNEPESTPQTLNRQNNDFANEVPVGITAPVPPSPVPQRQQSIQDTTRDELVRELKRAQDTITQLQRQLTTQKEEQEKRANGLRSHEKAYATTRTLAPTVQPLDAVHQRLAELEKPRVTEGYPPQVVLIVAVLVFILTYLFF
ncbi:phosphatidylinositol-binding protein scs2 [Apophysomyces ossiformis]|uniref:Phosphatidylinositol-binding protein scs2 n=1 Tax=Apophysomyces ossiformis TaxID=679940 RepID=A0A8H7BM52_9FUNG|nr:phosphatidylinositol-binding protein scs2 [Apophysomyces ossiformis]